MRDNLHLEFKAKEIKRQTEVDTERSRRINRSRIEVQEKRGSLLHELKDQLKVKLIKLTSDKQKYKDLLRKLIVQV